MLTKAIFTSALLSAVTAHQNLHQLWVNDVTPGYKVGIRMPPSNSPVTDVKSNDMVCNVGGTKVPSGVKTIEANEGDKIKVQWDQSGHPGPITHMLFGPVDDASQATGIGAGWFKIDELDYVHGKWASEIMGANNMTHNFTLPTGLASGEYLLRSEMLALHAAQTPGGGQFYIGCMQLKIKGTGTKGACSPTIKLPGAYKADDADIYIPNYYNGYVATNYKAPGGNVATCGAGGSGAAPVDLPSSNTTSPVAPETYPITTPVPTLPPSNATIPSTPTTLATLVSPSPCMTALTGSAGTVKRYYQCGGINYKGPTQCEGTAKCVKQNEFYYQCIN